MSIFRGWGMILAMKQIPFTRKIILECLTHTIEVLEKKPNVFKNISPSFKYLNFIFQSVTSFRSSSSTCK